MPDFDTLSSTTPLTTNEMIISIKGQWTLIDFSILFMVLDELYWFEKTFITGSFQLMAVKKFLRSQLILYTPSGGVHHHKDIRILDFIKEYIIVLNQTYQDSDLYNQVDFNLVFKTKEIFSFSGSLKVSSINYASPGKVTILDPGGFIKPIIELFKYYLPNKSARIDVLLKAEKLIHTRIETLEKAGYSKNEIKKLIGVYVNDIEIISGYHDNQRIDNISSNEVQEDE